jgi:hypothetical protein
MILILAGCAGQEKRSPPDWSAVALPAVEITDPAALPQLCEITVIQDAEGVKYGAWSPACWKALSAYEVTAEGNTDIAQSNANALRKTEAGYNSLISAGQMQQELTNFYAELLKDEKSGRFVDSLLYKTLIGLGFIVVML